MESGNILWAMLQYSAFRLLSVNTEATNEDVYIYNILDAVPIHAASICSRCLWRGLALQLDLVSCTLQQPTWHCGSVSLCGRVEMSGLTLFTCLKVMA